MWMGPNVTVPLGVRVRLELSEAENPRMEFLEAAVEELVISGKWSVKNDGVRVGETHSSDWDLRDGDGVAGGDAAGARAPDYGLGCGGVSADERSAGWAGDSAACSRMRRRTSTPRPDLVIVGNAISRGNVELEFVLDARIPFTSMAAVLHDEFLPGRESLVVAGTHGKTTTTSMLAWIYEVASRTRPELAPSFLIGGVAENFGTSFMVRPVVDGVRQPFILEGDEYDTAFFDKGPKFLHYFPDAAILTHVEFDHADIYRGPGGGEDGVQAAGEPDSAARAAGGVRRQRECERVRGAGVLRGGAVRVSGRSRIGG